MKPQGLLLLLIAVPNFVLGCIILARNFREKTNLYFSLFAFCVGFWSLGLAGYIFSNDQTAALLWAQLYYISAAIIAFAFLAFSMNFTDRWKSLSNLQRKLVFIPPIVLSLIILFYPSFLIDGLAYRDWGKEVLLNTRGYLVYTIYFSIYVFAGFLAIVSKMTKARGSERLYLKYVFLGLIVAFGLGATFNLFYPAFGNYKYIWVGPLFTLVYVSFISYAIVRHKLFDVRLVVARSIGYLLSVLVLGTVFGLIAFNFLAATIFKDTFIPIEQRFAYTVLFIAFSLIFQPLKKFFDIKTKRIFYRDAYETQDFLDEFNQVIVSTIDLNQLLARAGATIEKYLKPETVAFAIRDSEADTVRIVSNEDANIPKEAIEQIRAYVHKSQDKLIATDALEENQSELKQLLQEANIGMLVRVTTDVSVEGNGYIVMGYKKSGNMYNTQDTGAMEIVANELAIAMQNALQFEEIQRFNVTLQNTVEEKTRQLRKSNEKLKQMDETKDEFISMASHQLRTPLTSVKGYLSMVIEGDAGELNDMQKKLLDQAFVSSQRMVYLIADLLNVSRLRTGKFVIESAPTNLADVIQGEVEQLVETAESRNLELIYTKPKDFPMLMLDETKIRQVVMNFIDNAIYYTPSGGHIKIELKDTGKTVEYTVTDDGLGVPKAQQHHLFSKFFRAENAKKARPDGTGLGLFMAKKVIVAQGGGIIFKSTEGKGSTFGFSFDKAKLAVPDHYEAPEEINGIKFGPNNKPSP